MITITINVDGETVQMAPALAHPIPTPRAAWLLEPEFQLTSRQLDVLRMVATGMQYKEIALALGVSEKTIRTHLTDIYRKTGFHSNTMLVSYAWLTGLLTEQDIMLAWREIAPHLVKR